MTALVRCFRATLRQIAREREAFTVLVGATVIYGLFYPTPYLRQLLRKVPVMVVDRDQTRLSRQIGRWLDASEGVTISGRTNDLDAAQDAVRAGTAGRSPRVHLPLIPAPQNRRWSTNRYRLKAGHAHDLEGQQASYPDQRLHGRAREAATTRCVAHPCPACTAVSTAPES